MIIRVRQPAQTWASQNTARHDSILGKVTSKSIASFKKQQKKSAHLNVRPRPPHVHCEQRDALRMRLRPYDPFILRQDDHGRRALRQRGVLVGCWLAAARDHQTNMDPRASIRVRRCPRALSFSLSFSLSLLAHTRRRRCRCRRRGHPSHPVRPQRPVDQRREGVRCQVELQIDPRRSLPQTLQMAVQKQRDAFVDPDPLPKPVAQ